jgi:hypothetical protein
MLFSSVWYWTKYSTYWKTSAPPSFDKLFCPSSCSSFLQSLYIVQNELHLSIHRCTSWNFVQTTCFIFHNPRYLLQLWIFDYILNIHPLNLKICLPRYCDLLLFDCDHWSSILWLYLEYFDLLSVTGFYFVSIWHMWYQTRNNFFVNEVDVFAITSLIWKG